MFEVGEHTSGSEEAEHLGVDPPLALVDDMVDSGYTLDAVAKALPARWPVIERCRTAVLWWKACSTFKPDFYVGYLADNPWIHQPFEVYDTLRPEHLKARLGR